VNKQNGGSHSISIGQECAEKQKKVTWTNFVSHLFVTIVIKILYIVVYFFWVFIIYAVNLWEKKDWYVRKLPFFNIQRGILNNHAQSSQSTLEESDNKEDRWYFNVKYPPPRISLYFYVTFLTNSWSVWNTTTSLQRSCFVYNFTRTVSKVRCPYMGSTNSIKRLQVVKYLICLSYLFLLIF